MPMPTLVLATTATAMNRSHWILVAVLTAGAGGFVWANRQAGLEIAAAIAEQQAYIARQPWLRVVSQTYERGIFTSTAVVTLEPRGVLGEVLGLNRSTATPDKLPPRIVYRHEIRHGPLPNWRQGNFTLARAVVETRFRGDGSLAGLLPELFGPTAAALLVTEFSDDRNGIAKLRLPAISRYLSDNAKLTWQGLSGEIRFSRAYDRVNASLAMPTLDLTAKDSRASLHGARLQADLRLGAHGVWLGTAEAKTDKLSLTWPGQSVAVSGVGHRSEVTETGDFLDVSSRITARGIVSKSEKAGPVELSFSLRHLHGPSIRTLREAIEGLPARRLKPEAEVLEQQTLGRAFMNDLLSRQPELRIDALNVRMPAGELRLTLALRVLDYDAEVATPIDTLDGVEIDLDIDVSEALLLAVAEQAASRFGKSPTLGMEGVPAETEQRAPRAVTELIDGLVSKGRLVRDGEWLTANLRWREGGLKINGLSVDSAIPKFSAPDSPVFALPASD